GDLLQHPLHQLRRFGPREAYLLVDGLAKIGPCDGVSRHRSLPPPFRSACRSLLTQRHDSILLKIKGYWGRRPRSTRFRWIPRGIGRADPSFLRRFDPATSG